MMNFAPAGIYSDMSEDAYHADASLSASGIKDLMVSPLNYWVNSVLNPDREDKESEAQDEGKAWHKRLLEGEGAFLAVIVAEPDGINKRKKEWTEFKEANEGKIILSQKKIKQIQLAAKSIESNPSLRDLFSDGKSEVSIFWVDKATGIHMKRRIDRLKPKTICELKSFANMRDKQPIKAVGSAIAENKYWVDVHASLEAAESCGFPNCAFNFLFFQKGAVPHTVLRTFKPGNSYFEISQMLYRDAVGFYKECVDRWGYETPWVEEAELADLDDADLPSWAFS